MLIVILSGTVKKFHCPFK